jgi:NADPH:quinone reductase-like Zn-dependent oxidoreductase
MKAIVQIRYGSPDGLELREIENPTADDDQVLIGVRAASVNFADWGSLNLAAQLVGRLLRQPRTQVRGFDLAGRVEATGKKVTQWKPGDEVFGVGIGSFAELALTTENRIAPKPHNLTFEQSAAIPVAGVTALQGLRDKARLQPGQSVLVYGAGGGVGTFAVQIAKAMGARVTAVSNTANLDMLRSIGADEVLDYTREDFTSRGQRYDVLFDVGAGRSLKDCRRALTPSGIHVLAGAGIDPWPLVSRLVEAQLRARIGRQRIGTFLARARQPDLNVLKDLAEAGKLVPVIDRTYPLSGVPDAFRYLGTRGVRGKLVIRIG